jgi:hypothetical protein
LARAAAGLRAGGVTKQCGAFNSTHDAGLAVFLWMLGDVGLQRDLGGVLTGLEAWRRGGVDASRFLIHRVKLRKDFASVHAAFRGDYLGLGSGGAEGTRAADGLVMLGTATAGSGGSGGGGNGSSLGSRGSGVSLEAAALAWLASLKLPPPPLPQHGYLSSRHHAREKARHTAASRRQGAKYDEESGSHGTKAQSAVQQGAQVRDDGEWPTLTADDCTKEKLS